MRTNDMHDNAGTRTGFSVGNVLLGRHGVPRIVETVAGATVLRRQRRWAFSAPDDFCEFVVDGRRFLAIEPFGDDTEFWIVADPHGECAQLDRVQDAFDRHRVLFGLLDL